MEYYGTTLPRPDINTAYSYISDPNILKWENRLECIIKSIKEKNADIICLQEVELSTFKEDFRELIGEYRYSSHVVSNKRTSPIGNIIFYKRANLQLARNLYTSTAVICLFEIDNRKFTLVNAHLKAEFVNGEKTRESQLKSIIKNVRGDESVVIAGDFNDNLGEVNKEDGKERLLYKLLVESGFKIYNQRLTCCVNGNNFWSFDQVVYREINVNVDKCDEIKTIPGVYDGKFYPSDHLMVEFQIKY